MILGRLRKACLRKMSLVKETQGYCFFFAMIRSNKRICNQKFGNPSFSRGEILIDTLTIL